MKCNIFSCEYNNEKCIKDDEVIFSEGGDGIYCNCYKEKLSIKISRFKLIEANINDLSYIIVMATSYEKFSNLIKEILDEIKKKYNKEPNKLIFDYTCSLGTKDKLRYLEVDVNNYKITNAVSIEDIELKKELKKITCNELKNNHIYMKRSILTSTQVKMIEKGVII